LLGLGSSGVCVSRDSLLIRLCGGLPRVFLVFGRFSRRGQINQILLGDAYKGSGTSPRAQKKPSGPPKVAPRKRGKLEEPNSKNIAQSSTREKQPTVGALWKSRFLDDRQSEQPQREFNLSTKASANQFVPTCSPLGAPIPQTHQAAADDTAVAWSVLAPRL
jgi:hypothetical protein